MSDTTASRTPLKVLVYSDDVNTRQQVILALGRRPHPDLPELEYVEVATEPVVIQNMDAGDISLAILDGEAVPAGGMGIAKQLKDEIYQCPPVVVLTGRPQDAWLATWSRAEAAVPHPLDPIQLAETVVALLRARVPATSAVMTSTTLGRGPRRPRRRAGPAAAQTAWAMGEILGGRGHAGPRSPASRWRCAPRARPSRRSRARRRDVRRGDPAHRARARCSTWSAPAGTGRCRSTSRRWRRWSLPGAGARVVKHGNRSASSKSGSADVLEALGMRLDLPARRVAEVAEQAGITFCFSAAFHPAMRHAAVPRRELGIGTTFNFLGPLANPARPAAQAIGCADERQAPVMAGVFARRGVDAWVFRGDDGLDELTTTTTSAVWLVHDGQVGAPRASTPPPWASRAATTEDLRGRRRGAQRRRRAPAARRRGRCRCATRCCSMRPLPWPWSTTRPRSRSPALAAGLERAAAAIDSGAAQATLERWVEASAG